MTKRSGNQRGVYLSKKEWEEYDKISEREGFPNNTGFMVFLFRQFVCGNFVFKKKK